MLTFVIRYDIKTELKIDKHRTNIRENNYGGKEKRSVCCMRSKNNKKRDGNKQQSFALKSIIRLQVYAFMSPQKWK